MKKYLYELIEGAEDLKTKPVIASKNPEFLKNDFDLKINNKSFEGDFGELIQDVIKGSVNTQNPRFLNQLYGGSAPESWIGELLVALLNTSMATYEIAPLFTLMEKEIIRTLNLQIGFKEVEGLMVPGGSYANMMGLQCARFYLAPESKTKGLYQGPRFKVFISSSAHYSTEKALGLMGMGIEALVKVPVDDKKRMDVAKLREAIEQSKKDGYIPLCVVSTAGTTVWGSFDPINEIQKLCTEFKIWHHVDAAWGALALWSKKKEDFFQGIEKVDSFAVDFHKLLASTLTKGMFITAKPEVLKGANSGGGGSYIFHRQDESDNLDTGVYAIQCGRKVDSLPVWLQWKRHGTEQFQNKISDLYVLSSGVQKYLKENSDRYKLLLDPEYMNICFQILPKSSQLDVSQFNRAVRELIMQRGKFMVNFSRTKQEGVFIRLVLSHWGLNQRIILEFFEEVETVARQIEEQGV